MSFDAAMYNPNLSYFLSIPISPCVPKTNVEIYFSILPSAYGLMGKLFSGNSPEMAILTADKFPNPITNSVFLGIFIGLKSQTMPINDIM